MNKTFKTIDDYIAKFPTEVQEVLQKVRKTIAKAVPESEEAISYQMPTFKFRGKNLVHFAAWNDHLGFYPTPSGITEFEEKLNNYVRSKGAVQFPWNENIPYDLIADIAKHRASEIK